ncbi:cysteine-tRNA ligase [Vittaforma corneae ATCC 50505]|uniref:cysteine--tRNA ligase n=1 Tax=Vittaforma corneae (strain ATCC 50505) TaxID=993615 RepID=L2GM24_VITCO|nr:cysteine-tRNA ligase [Vittaforma corneae ATCC 50505]ELA41550.1 cysteine-tRNA ligase [Vittaforma corneae ATCC 50505]
MEQPDHQSLFLYNTLTKKCEKFTPNEGTTVKIYICGPTVYDSPHIGHARTYISFDIIRRVLRDYFKYDVMFVMNITNIDDKIIKRAAEKNISCEELGMIYEKEFLDEMENLNVLRPDFITRVTEYVPEIVKFIEKLEDKGMAYESNGSVYFNLTKYKETFKYNLLRPETTNEEEEDNSEKKSREDFVLWKASKPGEPIYESKWGKGRPGWHIECSVMASEILGKKLDIHAGGIDLAFPHHENEVAQCQGYFGDSWVKYFLHTGHLNIDGLKMSKSLKNFLTIRDIVQASSPLHLRVLFLQHQWNKEMNYDQDQLKEADAILKKIFNFVSNAESLVKRNDARPLNDLDRKLIFDLEASREEVNSALRNNINTSKALDVLLDLISNVNIHLKIAHTDVLRLLLNFILQILGIFGICQKKDVKNEDEKIAELLSSFRNEIRIALKNKSDSKGLFEICDKVRESIKEFGYVIDDSQSGSVLRKSM